MFIIQAPYPNFQTTLVMPSPEEGNRKNLAATVQIMRAMDSTPYTYVKTKRGRRVYQWDFFGTKEKGREAVEFAKRYNGSVVRAKDHHGDVYLGWITINPLELAGQGRAGGWPSGEAYSWVVSLEERV